MPTTIAQHRRRLRRRRPPKFEPTNRFEETSKMMNQWGEVACPGCGVYVEPSKLASHMKTKSCRHRTAQRAATARGYVSTWRGEAVKLREIGIETITIPSAHKKDRDEERVPKWASQLMSVRYPRWAGPLRKTVLERARDDGEFRDACLTAHELGRDVGLREFVFSIYLRVSTDPEDQPSCSERGATRCLDGFEVGEAW